MSRKTSPCSDPARGSPYIRRLREARYGREAHRPPDARALDPRKKRRRGLGEHRGRPTARRDRDALPTRPGQAPNMLEIRNRFAAYPLIGISSHPDDRDKRSLPSPADEG